MQTVGIVVIGRNEGERLTRCFDALQLIDYPTIYVDSGSTDSSLDQAKSRKLIVHELDSSSPFSAGRARNEGFQKLLELNPHLHYIQFIDGDCEIDKKWIASAVKKIESDRTIGAVNGVLIERSPHQSIYNRILDYDWKYFSEIQSGFGGVVMVRVDVFRTLQGFVPTIIAGEESDLQLRMDQIGYKLVHLNQCMAVHDANMTKFSQWFQRTKRTGYAYTESTYLNGFSKESYFLKDFLSILLWGFILPVLFFVFLFVAGWLSLLILALYLIQIIRIAKNRMDKGWSVSDGIMYACFCVLSKVPQFLGCIQFFYRKVIGYKPTIIEYK